MEGAAESAAEGGGSGAAVGVRAARGVGEVAAAAHWPVDEDEIRMMRKEFEALDYAAYESRFGHACDDGADRLPPGETRRARDVYLECFDYVLEGLAGDSSLTFQSGLLRDKAFASPRDPCSLRCCIWLFRNLSVST